MAANGADIVAIDICGFISTASNAKPATPEDLEETARQVRRYERRCIPIKADIRNIGQLRQIAAHTKQEFGRIDIAVADAPIQRWKPLLEMEDVDWHDVIDNNLNGTANTIRAFAPIMVGQRYGRIIVLSSMQGKHGTKDVSSYSASKWGILGLMKSAAMELDQYGITVNALIPGLIDTPLTMYPARLSPNFLFVTFSTLVQRADISEISHTCAAADVPITGYSHAGIVSHRWKCHWPHR